MTSFMDNKAPRVTLRQWAVFAAIAQCETTTAAGSQLGLSQSAVSAALASPIAASASCRFDSATAAFD